MSADGLNDIGFGVTKRHSALRGYVTKRKKSCPAVAWLQGVAQGAMRLKLA
jgi:hypothetical protein